VCVKFVVVVVVVRVLALKERTAALKTLHNDLLSKLSATKLATTQSASRLELSTEDLLACTLLDNIEHCRKWIEDKRVGGHSQYMLEG